MDALGNIGVLPLEGSSIRRISADVAHQFSGKIFDGGEDAASDRLAFDAREPNLDLIEPGRVGGREV